MRVADLADSSSLSQASQTSHGQAGVTTETVDIWVNDRDLLVKKVEQGEHGERPDDPDRLLQRLRRRRSPPQVPPASDTADFKELVRQQSGGPT